jgi:hypothetical protein
MNIKSRIKRLEATNKDATARRYGCPDLITIGDGEVFELCPDCRKILAAVVLPSFEDAENLSRIPAGVKLYAGFNPALV